ncbi:MAG TPA: L-histidine N(alpha)-methyltransferase [Steroidobacteraceae bacterium]|jgi:dimethylhistidine N-methyltransferase
MTEHLDSNVVTVDDTAAAFAADVRAGLGHDGQKTLSPKYLYDTLGSALFEAITQLPEYGLWRAEGDLLYAHAEDIARSTEAANLIELGSGSANKTAHLVRVLLRRHPVSYATVDLSPSALEMTRRELGALRGLNLRGIEGEYLSGLELAVRSRPAGRPVLVLFLGSSLGNFDYAASRTFLRRIRRLLQPGDSLLLGVDLQKPVAQMVAAYDDALGVTAAFNLNLLVRMNRELGANFQLPQFAHRARFNALTRDVEMHIESRDDQRVQIPGARLQIGFRAGETVHTESSHKYSPEELDSLTQNAAFSCTAQWVDADWRFMSALYQAL